MNATTTRRWRLSLRDLLVAVAALAAGFAVTRTLPRMAGMETRVYLVQDYYGQGSKGGVEVVNHGPGFTVAGRPLTRRASYWLTHIAYWSGPCLAAGTTAAAVRGWFGAGPSSRRRRRPAPGVLVGLTLSLVGASLVLECAQCVTVRGVTLAQSIQYPEWFFGYCWAMLPRRMGFTVAVLWLGLSVAGRRPGGPRRRPEPGWLLGAGWVGAGLASELGIWCFGLNY